jgi:dipeptidyl aminopeptidase/acylaminoacyl peptidase
LPFDCCWSSKRSIQLIAKYWQQVLDEDVSKRKEVVIMDSPLNQMDKFASEASIQLFYGGNDPRAPFVHGVRVVDELKKQIRRGKVNLGEFISFANEGHGIPNVLYVQSYR